MLRKEHSLGRDWRGQCSCRGWNARLGALRLAVLGGYDSHAEQIPGAVEVLLEVLARIANLDLCGHVKVVDHRFLSVAAIFYLLLLPPPESALLEEKQDCHSHRISLLSGFRIKYHVFQKIATLAYFGLDLNTETAQAVTWAVYFAGLVVSPAKCLLALGILECLSLWMWNVLCL